MKFEFFAPSADILTAKDTRFKPNENPLPWAEVPEGMSFRVPNEYGLKESSLRTLASREGKKLGRHFRVMKFPAGYEVLHLKARQSVGSQPQAEKPKSKFFVDEVASENPHAGKFPDNQKYNGKYTAKGATQDGYRYTVPNCPACHDSGPFSFDIRDDRNEQFEHGKGTQCPNSNCLTWIYVT
jgi:hypothetical protein